MTVRSEAIRYAAREDALARLLGSTRDLTILQGEAILALEAVTRGLGGPGVRALNLVSGPYGEAIGNWLAVGGAHVDTLWVDFDRALAVDAVDAAVRDGGYDVVSVVHAEAATGVVNPLEDIAATAHRGGALVVVDAVASVGAEPLDIEGWDLDAVMLGTQKALSGPNGVCAVVLSERAWTQMAANPAAPRNSVLSLLDWRERWLLSGRSQLPGYVHTHEMAVLDSALVALEDDVGLGQLISRHHCAAAAVRSGAPALGFAPWVSREAEAAGVVTLLTPPEGVAIAPLLDACQPWLAPAEMITAAPGSLADRALRVNHTGAAASAPAVLGALTALAFALDSLGRPVNLDDALGRARRAL